MDSDSIGSIIALVALIAMSAYFSATETAFSSLNRIRLKNMAEDGDAKASRVLRLSENFDKLLSTVLVGNNIVNIAATSIATVLFVKYYGNIGATLSTIVMTVVVLIFGEISPKSLAKESPEKFAMISAPVLRVLMVILTPVNFLFAQWKKLLSKLFKNKDDRSITEEELLTFVDEAEQEGAIDEEDSQLIRSVIEFNDLTAGEILTPRVSVVGIPKDAHKNDIGQIFIDTGYTRIPVYDGTIDHILGILHLKDFYNLPEGRPLSSVLSSVVYAIPTTRIGDLLKMLQQKKSHLAVITDEYGGTMGIVTMEDILEELVGEIYDEHDKVEEAEIVKRDDETYTVKGEAELRRLFDILDIDDDEQTHATTVSGWIMEKLGKIPQPGDVFDYENMTVTVESADDKHVLQCVVKINEPDTGASD